MEVAPCELCPDDALPADHLMEWLQENCPDHILSPPGALTAQLAKGLEVDERMLHIGVESVLTDFDLKMTSVHDSWLHKRDVTLDAYLNQVRLVGEDCDGLFIWGASWWLNKRITIASMAGLWSSLDDGGEDELLLVFMENGFHHLLLLPTQQEESLVYPLQPPNAGWTMCLPLLGVLVCDLDDVQIQTGFIPKADQ